MAKPTDLVQGTLDLLILRTIALEPKHGWAIAKRIQQVSQEALQIQQGSLYPALHRLEQQAWIKAEWRPTETGRMAKFYSLTRSGRKQLERELANWARLSTAINIVVQEAYQCGCWTNPACGFDPCSAVRVSTSNSKPNFVSIWIN